MSQNILLISDTIIKERTSIHGNIDPKLIYPDIKVAQDMYIQPMLGSALYTKLQTIISDGTISQPSNSEYKTLLDQYIIDTLIYYTLSELPIPISFQFWNKGMVRKQGEDTELPSMTELVEVSNMYRNRAEFYSNRMMKYLQQNAPTKFFEYLNPGTGIDTMKPENKAFTMPIFLGDDCDCHRSYEEKYQGNRPNCCD